MEYTCGKCYWWDAEFYDVDMEAGVGVCRADRSFLTTSATDRCQEFLTTKPCVACDGPVMVSMGNLLEEDVPLHEDCDPPSEMGRMK